MLFIIMECYLNMSPAKLEAGIEFGHYVVSYGDKPNDYDAVSTCMYLSAT